MNCQAIEAKARALASSAKPGFERINGKLYTFSFDQNEWVYQIYEDGFEYIRFNCKRLSQAKRMLREWLAS